MTSTQRRGNAPLRARFGAPPSPASAPRRHPWAELLQRVFEVDALCCPHCGGRMRILAAITDAGIARRILACLALPTRAPPAMPARASPEVAPGAPLDRLEAAPGDFEFDQSPPQAWDVGA